MQGLINRQIQGTRVDHPDLSSLDQRMQFLIAQQLAGALLKGRNHTGLTPARTFSEKFCRQYGFSGAGRPHHEQRIANWHAATQHVIQAGYSHRNTFLVSGYPDC